MTLGEFRKVRGLTARPIPGDAKTSGFFVKYHNGYTSWCPREVFLAQGFPLEDGSKITEGDIANFNRLSYSYLKTVTAHSGKPVTLVEREYPTGFVAFETSCCVDPKNYSEEIGARTCALRLNTELWKFLGFMLQWANNGITDAVKKYIPPKSDHKDFRRHGAPDEQRSKIMAKKSVKKAAAKPAAKKCCKGGKCKK
jgi:hypothetical protein